MITAPAPAWIEPYIGIQHKDHGRDRDGLDCWGLGRLLMRDRKGIELPAYASGYEGTSNADAEDIARLIAGNSGDWTEIAAHSGTDPMPWLRAMETMAREGDFLLIRFWQHPMHVAYYVQPGLALHVLEGAQTTQLRYQDAEWRHKILAVYRHNSLV